MKKIYILFLCVWLAGGFYLMGCSSSSSDYNTSAAVDDVVSHEEEEEVEPPETPLAESEEFIVDDIGHPLLDALSGAIWGLWDKVDIPDAICGNGTSYKIFVMRSKGIINWILGNDKKLLIYLEPGGACWDYESCTGQSGIRGAANPMGIPDNYMNLGDMLDQEKIGGSPMAAISPLILRNHPTGRNVKTSQWNKVFIPYCTGDVHSGNKVVRYSDPKGEELDILYHHKGAKNIEKVIEYLKQEFPEPDEMVVTGCSAGGTGALVNYHFFREALNPEKSYLLVDSGPIYPANAEFGNHYPLHKKISEAWNVDYVAGRLMDQTGNREEFEESGQNLGILSEVLADYYPEDQLGITLFKRDANYSMYSYTRFFDLDEEDPDEFEDVMGLWSEDIDLMTRQYDSRDNLSYFIPYYRNMNESHCTCIVTFAGTEFYDTGFDVGDYIDDLLDGDDETQSYYEEYNEEDEDFIDFWMLLVNELL